MAKYHYRGPDMNLFTAQTGGSLKGRFLYRQADQFGLTNPDGSKTYYLGMGLTWDGTTGHFTAGTITAIYHYSADGTYIDGLTGLAISMNAIEPLLTAAVSVVSASALLTALLAGDDTLQGDNGNNALNGAGGNDILSGGAGNDQLTGDTGNDQLQGGNGNDVLTGGAGADILLGGDGRDVASYRASPEDIHIDLTAGTASGGDATGDRLTGIENIEGSVFADFIIGNAADNWLTGFAGADTLHGEAGKDRLDGGAGEDFLTGSEGDDLILGGDGDDAIDAGSGRDLVVGGAGNDVIYGGPDPDVIIYDFTWEQLRLRYAGSDYSIWVDAPDGKDHVYSALTFATNSGTYRYDVPTEAWVFVSTMTGDDWLAQW